MNENEFFKEKQELDIVAKITHAYLPYWPLFIVTTAFSMIVAILYLRSEVPSYVASAKVLLKDPNKGSDTKILDALNIFGDKKIVDNEIVVMRSATLMTDVVRTLNIYAFVFNKGKVKVEDLYGSNSPLWIEAVNKDRIQSTGRYFFTMDWVHKKILVDGKKISFDSTIDINGALYLLKVNPDYNTQLIGKNFFFQIVDPGSVAGSIVGNLRVFPTSTQSTVLNAALEISEPEKGKAILNTLFQIYNRNAVVDKNQNSTQTLAFIDDRLRLVSGQVDSVEKKIVAFKSSEKIFDLSKQSENYLNTIKTLDQKVTEIDLQMDILNDINNYVRSKGTRTGTVPAISLISDPILADLLKQLYQLEGELSKIKTFVGDKSEAVIEKEGEISKVKHDILENIANIRKTYSTSKNFNQGILNQNNNLLSSIPQKERALLEISRNQAVKNALLTFLLQKREETAISAASNVPDLRVVELPTASGQVKPVAKNYYITGLIIGILLSVFVVLIKEQFNSKILFRMEIDTKTHVPMVGELLQVSTDNPIVVLEGKRSIIAEQFRSLRTNLGFMGVNDTNNKTILITSSISGEGKSFVGINLAIAFSFLNKRVALLELDLRKPRLSKLMELPRDPGISNFLIGKAVINDIIKPTKINNLFVVSSGPIPPNPTELIMRPEFKIMMDDLKSRFDYIIIDTAPVGPVSDAHLISSFADTTLFVVRHDFTPKLFLKMIKSVYEENRFKNMAIVFNGLKKRGISLYSSDYRGYEYGYGYGYGYGGYPYGDKSKSSSGSLLQTFKKLFNRDNNTKG